MFYPLLWIFELHNVFIKGDSKPTAMCSVIGLDSGKVAELCEAATEAAGAGESVQIANFLCK